MFNKILKGCKVLKIIKSLELKVIRRFVIHLDFYNIYCLKKGNTYVGMIFFLFTKHLDFFIIPLTCNKLI